MGPEPASIITKTSLGAAFAIFFGLMQTPAEAGSACFKWIEARPIIAHHNLVSVRKVRDIVTKQFGGMLIGARLCDYGQKYAYELVVLEHKGRVRKLAIDGRTGRSIKFRRRLETSKRPLP